MDVRFGHCRGEIYLFYTVGPRRATAKLRRCTTSLVDTKHRQHTLVQVCVRIPKLLPFRFLELGLCRVPDGRKCTFNSSTPLTGPLPKHVLAPISEARNLG